MTRLTEELTVVRLEPTTIESLEPTTIETRHPSWEPEEKSDVETLQSRLERLDVELLSLVRRRISVARELAAARVKAGGTRFVHEHELAAVRRFLQLGPLGTDFASILLRLSR